MRIVTPANASFGPGGPVSSDGFVSQYEFTGTCSADFGPDSNPFFTPASDGQYAFYVFAQSLDANAVSGALLIEMVQPAPPRTLASNNCVIFGLDGTIDPNSAISGLTNVSVLVSGGPITIETTVSGFAGAPSGYRFVVRAVLLA